MLFLNCMLLLSVLTSTLVLGINYFVIIKNYNSSCSSDTGSEEE